MKKFELDMLVPCDGDGLSLKVKVAGQTSRSQEETVLLKWSVRPQVRTFQLLEIRVCVVQYNGACVLHDRDLKA